MHLLDAILLVLMMGKVLPRVLQVDFGLGQQQLVDLLEIGNVLDVMHNFGFLFLDMLFATVWMGDNVLHHHHLLRTLSSSLEVGYVLDAMNNNGLELALANWWMDSLANLVC